MGQLITLSNIDMNPTWYFSDAYYSNDGRRYIYKWPSPDWPFRVTIHNEKLNHYNDRKIQIRRWVERTISDTVICSDIDKSYRVYYGEDKTWEHSYERTNWWVAFDFEDEHSAMMFRIAFSEYVQEMTDLHPDREDEYEKTSLCKNYR